MAIGVYIFGHKNGLPEETCQNYEARNPDKFSCSDIQKCKDCYGPAPNNTHEKDPTCKSVPQGSYPVWKISEYGVVRGAVNMKAEIYARGIIRYNKNIS